GLQEINQAHEKLLEKLVKSICDGRYKIAFKQHFSGPDAERVLTTFKIKSQKVLPLSGGGFRNASRVVLSSPEGPIVLVVTHQDGDPDVPFTGTCRTCKPPCTSSDTPTGCQTTAALAFGAKVGGPDAIHILMGDFNVTP